MPQAGWRCVFNDNKKEFSECIQCARSPDHCEFTPEMLISMRRGLYPRDPEYISITRVFAMCTRQSVLEAFFEYWCSPRKNYYAFRGNLAHGVMAGIRERDAWKEITWSRELDVDGEKIPIWGTADKIVPSVGLIRDYKTTAMIPKSDEPYGKHGLQLNGYRWIWQPVLNLDKLRVQYIDMRGTKQIKVPLMDLDALEETMRDSVRLYINSIRTETIPPGAHDSSRWECRYCDLTDVCKEITELQGESIAVTVKKAGKTTASAAAVKRLKKAT